MTLCLGKFSWFKSTHTHQMQSAALLRKSIFIITVILILQIIASFPGWYDKHSRGFNFVCYADKYPRDFEVFSEVRRSCRQAAARDASDTQRDRHMRRLLAFYCTVLRWYFHKLDTQVEQCDSDHLVSWAELQFNSSNVGWG